MDMFNFDFLPYLLPLTLIIVVFAGYFLGAVEMYDRLGSEKHPEIGAFPIEYVVHSFLIAVLMLAIIHRYGPYNEYLATIFLLSIGFAYGTATVMKEKWVTPPPKFIRYALNKFEAHYGA